MRTTELANKIKTYLDIPIFPDILTFTDKSYTHGVYAYNNRNNSRIDAVIGDIYFQFITASDSYVESENECINLLNWFNQKLLINELVDNYKILSQEVLNITPRYIGKTDDNKYQFSFNIRMYVNKI